jgi:hypothetical protein
VTFTDRKWLFPHLNRDNYHAWDIQIAALLYNRGLWMYLGKPLPVAIDGSYDLVCLKKDEALVLITLYMEPNLVHHTNNKSAKQVWDSFHTLFGAVNTNQINRLETGLSNLKMADFATIENIYRFKNLKTNIFTSGGNSKTESGP